MQTYTVETEQLLAFLATFSLSLHICVYIDTNIDAAASTYVCMQYTNDSYVHVGSDAHNKFRFESMKW